MKILIGTTNPSKIKRFQELLQDQSLSFITLNDLNIQEEPLETGSNPKENAIIKAKFYSQYFDRVICNDSGLYFSHLPLNDSRQPGLHIRTIQDHRLNDEEMIDYYSHLIESLGGTVEAYYLDGFAVMYKGKLSSFMDIELSKENRFYMVSQASSIKVPGWPLDSLSIDKKTGHYFSEDPQENIIKNDYNLHLTHFLKESLK